MATISTNTYLDSGTARTSAESWTINDGLLTIRTDTRWHAGSPASMTGTIGDINFSTNVVTGGVFLDGTKVRWMAYDSGTGNVPAIGTTITQGGVSGYLLGVWANYTSAPTAVGAAMPTTGYIKFREVTGGQFTTGALTGIGANSTEADRVGWIEVVINSTSYINLKARGPGFKTRGDWFELGTTTGTPGQVIQVPTNAGGSATSVPGIQIETSPGSNVYEWYPSLTSAISVFGWYVTALATDIRGKVVNHMGNGQVRIGSDGTTTMGYTPPAGCKIRIPNILLRHAASATPATNAYSASSRPRITSTSGGIIDIENVASEISTRFEYASSLKLKHSAIEHIFHLVGIQSYFDIDNIGFGFNTTNGITNTFTSNLMGGSVKNSYFAHSQSAATINILSGNNTITFDNIKIFKPSTRSSTYVAFASGSSCTLINSKIIGGYLSLTASSEKDVVIKNLDYTDRSFGESNNTGTQSMISGSGWSLDGLTFGFNGTIANQHPVASLVTASGRWAMKNIGTPENPLSAGTNSSFSMLRLAVFTGTTYGRMQRVYFTNTRSGNSIFNMGSTYGTKDIICENVSAGPGRVIGDIYGNDISFKSVRGSLGSNNALAAGSQIFTYFDTDTTGIITFLPNQNSALSSNTTTVTSGCEFNMSGTVNFKTTDDFITFEVPYFIKGFTGFSSSGHSISKDTYTVVSYQIDTGSGWNGTWKEATGANLSSEVISPSLGFKIKIKTTSTLAGGFLNYVHLATTTTLAAQTENLYPLSTATLSFTGLITGSEVRVYKGTDPATALEIGGIESTSGSTFSLTQSYPDEAGYIVILAMGYQPIYLPYTFKSVDENILIQPVIDRNYNNPA